MSTAEVSLRGRGASREGLMVLYKITDIVQVLPRPQRMLPAASVVSTLISFKNKMNYSKQNCFPFELDDNV